MHLASPVDAMREFVRVARPGGVVIAAEPLNLLNRSPITLDLEPEAHARLFRFWRHHELGLLAEGRGFHSLGAELPMLFQQAGLTGSQFYINDKTFLSDGNVSPDFDLDQLARPTPEDYQIASEGGAPEHLRTWITAFFKQPGAYRINGKPPCSLEGPYLAQTQSIVGIGFKAP
jgi:hypothetical protein